MKKLKVIIQDSFTLEEAQIARAKNPKAKLCDKNNFCFFNFDDAEIIAGNKSKFTSYLVSKAKGENPKPIKD